MKVRKEPGKTFGLKTNIHKDLNFRLMTLFPNEVINQVLDTDASHLTLNLCPMIELYYLLDAMK